MSMNIQTAHFLARASRVAYAGAQDVENYYPRAWGYNEGHFLDEAGTQAYVMSGDSGTLMAFRGTQPDKLEDWKTDINRRLVPGPWSGRVHEGADIALDAIWPEVKFLANTSPPPFLITGHSLGAMLATIATARLVEGHPSFGLAGLYTFGQPRTGDSVFAREFNKHINAYRFVNNNDIVTRLPALGSYKHIGKLMYLTASGGLMRRPFWWQVSMDRAYGRWNRWMADGIQDHSALNGYETILRRLTTNEGNE